MARVEPNLPSLTDEAWRSVEKREPVVRQLAALDCITDADMRAAMGELGLGRARIYTLVRRYRSNSVATSLLNEQPGPRPGTSKLRAEVDELIEELIDRAYLTRQKPTVSALCRAIAHECMTKNLTAPSRAAITARLKRRKTATAFRLREGSKAANARFRPSVKSFEADYPLHIVQIDHTKVDQFVVDEHTRKPIGRPWLTIAIDVASRMVAGFYLTFESPSAVSVAMTLRHAVAPKEEWLAERGITAAWPVSGLPKCLHMDNGKDFHSRALERGCIKYGIERQYRPPATPHYGGHIERLIGSMMGAVHLLPGTTHSNIVEKGDYDPAATAVMTLAELEKWLAIEVVGVYHARLHNGIGRPPFAAWETLMRRPQSVRHPQDLDQFLLDFLPFEYRTIRRDGVRLFNVRYWDSVLTTWIGEKLKLPVKYDPRDLSQVFVQAPDGQHWPVPYADLTRPSITLWELKRAMAILRDEGRGAVDDRLIFDAVEAQRMLVREAMGKSMKARRTANRTAHALSFQHSGAGRVPVDAVPHREDQVADLGDTYLPYPVEEWS